MITLPSRVGPAALADLCREAAYESRFQPQVIEKDYVLTRLLWALGQRLGSQVLLKGGTLLSKVDLGFRRMSEDVDLVIPWDPSAGYRTRWSNVQSMKVIRDNLNEIAAAANLHVKSLDGERFQQGSHVIWTLDYDSAFGAQSITVEASLQIIRAKPRQVELSQLLQDSQAGDYQDARCWALDEDEARAEKVRAAFTREAPAIRDYYDLLALEEIGKDLSSAGFITRVDEKLAEVKSLPLASSLHPSGEQRPNSLSCDGR